MKKISAALVVLVVAWGILGFMAGSIAFLSSPDAKEPVTKEVMVKPRSIVEIREALQNSQTDMIKRCMKSVVHLSGEEGRGTGFYVGNGIIVTAGHVAQITEITATFEDGFVCTVIRQITHQDYDCGFIIIEPIDRPALEFSMKKLQRGEEVFILGNPRHFQFTAVKGIICGFISDEYFGKSELIICDAVPNYGNSGSPLLSVDGEVYGVWVGGWTTRCGELIPGGTVSIGSEDILVAMAEHNL